MKYKDEIIILIEYYNDIPSLVLTESSTYDFERYNDDDWLMFDQSGWGNNYSPDKKITYPLGIPCEPEKWKIWIEDGYSCDISTDVTVIKKPLMLPLYHDGMEKHNNPFVVGDEVDEIFYCEKCGKHYNDDGCPVHGYDYEEE